MCFRILIDYVLCTKSCSSDTKELQPLYPYFLFNPILYTSICSVFSLKISLYCKTLWTAKTPNFLFHFLVEGLSMLTFMLPAESSEKITLGITVFLSYSFLIVIVADSTPQTGAQPQLGI